MVVVSSIWSFLVFVVLYLSILPSCCLSSQLNLDQQVALFIFGDSLLDHGNNNYINTSIAFQVNFWPYGQSYFNTPTGRFNDGRIISDFIGEQYLTLFILTFFSLHSILSSFSNN